MSKANLPTRLPRFADDRWYSADAPQLQQEVQGYLAKPPATPDLEAVMGLVAPHAGYYFSGHVAGAAFAALSGRTFETVVLIGPDHRGSAPGQISTLQVDAWRTPLGDVPVAWDLLQALQTRIELKLLSTDNEHALEIELPFLQASLERFKLVPLMMGDQTPQTCRLLGQALVTAHSDSQSGPILLVASSDLSHYYDDDTARRLDKKTLQFILDLDGDGLARHAETGRQRGQPLACGAGPIAVIIHAAKALGAAQAHLVKYATSADVSHRKDQVVGYAAVAIGK